VAAVHRPRRPQSPDLPAAKEELAKWQGLADSGAEKIKGKWVGGEERKQILAKASKLKREADELLEKKQTLQALKKLEEAAAAYPNSYEATFQIAFIAMIGHNEQKAQEWLGKAQQLRPDAPEVLGNQALLLCSKGKFDLAIPLMHKALQKGDRKEIVHNLILAISQAPPAVRKRKGREGRRGGGPGCWRRGADLSEVRGPVHDRPAGPCRPRPGGRGDVERDRVRDRGDG
jgi:tetratricopeptide (TPR) repeat protein